MRILCIYYFSQKDNLQKDGTTRITCNGRDLTQMSTISTFSEYTVTSEYNVTKVSTYISYLYYLSIYTSST